MMSKVLAFITVLFASALLLIGFCSFVMWTNFFIVPISEWENATRFFFCVYLVVIFCLMLSDDYDKY